MTIVWTTLGILSLLAGAANLRISRVSRRNGAQIDAVTIVYGLFAVAAGLLFIIGVACDGTAKGVALWSAMLALVVASASKLLPTKTIGTPQPALNPSRSTAQEDPVLFSVEQGPLLAVLPVRILDILTFGKFEIVHFRPKIEISREAIKISYETDRSYLIDRSEFEDIGVFGGRLWARIVIHTAGGDYSFEPVRRSDGWSLKARLGQD